MTTPPVQPPQGNDPENAPQQPQYGQNAPQYGQQSPPQPQYGQNAPQYGQQAPQYDQQQPGYGQQAPYGQPAAPFNYPSEQPQPAGATGVPPQVDLSFKMILAAGAISAISSLVLAFAGGDFFWASMEEQLQSQGQEIPPGMAEGMKSAVMIGGIISALVSIGLYALVAFPVRKGKNWARILGTVFAAISVFGLFSLFQFGPLYGVMQLIAILLGIAAIVLLYLPANAPYFQKQQAFGNPYGR